MSKLRDAAGGSCRSVLLVLLPLHVSSYVTHGLIELYIYMVEHVCMCISIVNMRINKYSKPHVLAST